MPVENCSLSVDIQKPPLLGWFNDFFFCLTRLADSPYSCIAWVCFNYFFIKQLEIIKRPTTFLGTHIFLTINLPKLPFRLYTVKRLCYKFSKKS